MTTTRAALAHFIARFTGSVNMPPRNADLFDKLGIDGDDAFQFIAEFGRTFEVDMTGYCWYFHHGEEGWGLGGLFYKPPYKRVEAIPITIDLLEDAVIAKKWPVDYPPHSLPVKRWDLFINKVVAITVAGLCVVLVASRVYIAFHGKS